MDVEEVGVRSTFWGDPQLDHTDQSDAGLVNLLDISVLKLILNQCILRDLVDSDFQFIVRRGEVVQIVAHRKFIRVDWRAMGSEFDLVVSRPSIVSTGATSFSMAIRIVPIQRGHIQSVFRSVGRYLESSG